MPGFDRTGPEGRGPMTGRGLGFCNDYRLKVGYRRGVRPRFGLRSNRAYGFGKGYGYRARFRALEDEAMDFNTSDDLRVRDYKEDKSTKKEQLKQELKDLEEDKKEIQKELENLEKE
jgi:hypothetical protein